MGQSELKRHVQAILDPPILTRIQCNRRTPILQLIFAVNRFGVLLYSEFEKLYHLLYSRGMKGGVFRLFQIVGWQPGHSVARRDSVADVSGWGCCGRNNENSGCGIAGSFK